MSSYCVNKFQNIELELGGGDCKIWFLRVKSDWEKSEMVGL